ncbi:MAG: nitroreductase family protein, partial [Burkholderiaceae bacterium]|nr:nitroreductase family protein [Burkholderiaceae bacterium]
MSNYTATIVDATIQSRRSVRAFRPEDVPPATLRQILEVAARAPSAANMQPWRVYVLTGTALRRTVEAVCHAFDDEPGQHTSEYQYYPSEYFEPYLSRRRKMGLSMYALLGIE